jgi:hypothetical protein
MYDALAREHLHMEQDQIRRRLEVAARYPRAWDDEPQAAASQRLRRWWPRRQTLRWG